MAGYDADVFGTPAGGGGYEADLFPKPKLQQVEAKPEPVTDFSYKFGLATPFGTIRTPLTVPSAIGKRLAQFGSGIADIGLGARQLLSSDKPQGLSDLVTGDTESKRLRREAADKRLTDAALNDDLLGKGLNIAGKVAPMMAAPQIAGAPLLSGAIAGGLSGALEPLAGDESRIARAAVGAGLGMAVPAAVQGVAKVLRPDEATRATAQKAAQYGIPVAPGDLTSNGLVKGVRSLFNDLPVIGAPGRALKDQQQAALNAAVGEQFGVQGAKRLTPDVVDAAKQRMGAEFDRLWGSNSLTVDAPLIQQIQKLQAVAADMPKAEGSELSSKINDFLSRMQPGQGGAPTISGEAANNFQQWLRQQAAGKQGFAQEAVSDLRKSILDAFGRSVSPADAAALTLNRSQYKAFKTVEPLLDKGAAAVAGRIEGNIPAALLPAAVQKSYSGLSSRTNAPPLADLAQVAGRFLVDRTPQTGGSARALAQNMGVMGGGMAGLYANPVGTAAGIGGALATNSLLNSGRAGAALLKSVPPVGLLSSPSLSRAAKEAGLLALERSPLAAMGLIPQLSALE